MATAATDLYVSQWPEENWLAYFWAVVNDGADRIEALQKLSKVVIPRPADWSHAAVREASRRPNLRISGCLGCYTQARRLYWHHVIWVTHGGSAAGRNLVALCLRCHSVIHPWLPANRPGERRSEWTSVGEVAAAWLQSVPDESSVDALEEQPS